MICISGLDFIIVISIKIFGVVVILIVKVYLFYGDFSCCVVGVQVVFCIVNCLVYCDFIVNVELFIVFGYNFMIVVIDSYCYVIFVGICSFICCMGNLWYCILNGVCLFRDNLLLF